MKDHEHWKDKDPNLNLNLNPLDQYTKESIQWVYVSGYYDGPLNGRVVLKSPRGATDSSAEVLWATIAEECDLGEEQSTTCGFYRRYRLIRLNKEADEEEKRRHALFEEHVGSHWRYDEDGKRHQEKLKPQSEWHKYYDPAKTWPKWTPEGEYVGWFEL